MCRAVEGVCACDVRAALAVVPRSAIAARACARFLVPLLSLLSLCLLDRSANALLGFPAARRLYLQDLQLAKL